MSLILTTLGSDNFHRANENPLANPPWVESNGAGNGALCVSSDACEEAPASPTYYFYSAEFYNYAPGTPNDQFASITIGAISSGGSNFYVGSRVINNSTYSINENAGYVLRVESEGNWTVICNSNLVSTGSASVNTGDVWAIAVLGTTVYVLKNGVVLSSVTNTTTASGQTACGLNYYNTPSDTTITNFAMGSVTDPAGPTPTPDVASSPYLGCVTLTNGGANPGPGQSGQTYLGKVRIVASARAGAPNPYLGNMTLVSGPPSGYDGNSEFLGEVTVVSSPPNNLPANQLGQVQQTT